MADLAAGIACSVQQERQRGSLHSGMGLGASSRLGKADLARARAALRAFAQRLDRLESSHVVGKYCAGHLLRWFGVGQPLRMESQKRYSIAKALQDERSPSGKILFHDPAF